MVYPEGLFSLMQRITGRWVRKSAAVTALQPRLIDPLLWGCLIAYNSFLLHANAIALFAENWYNRIRTCC